jgi:uncharacterized tellurite resistance protein B-like protein
MVLENPVHRAWVRMKDILNATFCVSAPDNQMTTQSNSQILLKILIGTAWLDGQVQPQEREYLHRIAQETGLAEDREIQPLLYEFRSVKAEECYAWIQEYLGDRPTSQDCQKLIEQLSALIYSDGTIANEEAKLLTRLQILDANSESNAATPYTKVLDTIRNLYQRWVSTI